MYKGIDIRYATRPTADDTALMELRKQLRQEEDRHQSLRFKISFLGERLQAAIDAGRADNAIEAATLFARLKEDLTIRFKNIVALNREIAAIDPAPKPARAAAPMPDPVEEDALITRILNRIGKLAMPNPIAS